MTASVLASDGLSLKKKVTINTHKMKVEKCCPSSKQQMNGPYSSAVQGVALPKVLDDHLHQSTHLDDLASFAF
jgi:hypothetical protein